MANAEISRTAEASDGNMECIITTLNEMEPIITTANELAPQPPKRVGIWEQIRLHIDPVSKLVSALWTALLMAWSVGLLMGGIFFLLYYWSIGFIPELDLKASVTVLATSAMTGTITLLILGIVLLGPAVMWRLMIQTSTSLKGFWYKEGKLMRGRAFLWLVLPVWAVLASIFIASLLVLYEVVEREGIISQGIWIGGFLISGTTTVFCLRIRHEQEWKAIWVFFKQFVGAVFLFCLAFLVVFIAMQWAAFSDTTAAKALIDYILVLFMIVLLDGLIATEWPDNTDRQSLRAIAFIILVSMCLFMISMLMSIHKAIPNQIMYQYKIGFLHNVSLILDDVGCAIVKSYGLQEKLKDIEGGTCRLSGVTIHSRLGTTYYVEVDGVPPPMRFTIPTQRVLSWAVTQPKKSSTAEVPQSPQNPASTAGTAQSKDNRPSNEN
jgi:hypothetical protein